MLSAFYKSFNPDMERCPSCGAKGGCRFFSSYKRYIVDAVNGQILTEECEILRLICSCGHTHAILPDFIVPYDSYSLPCILYILRAYFAHSMTIGEICDAFGISYSTLYRWKAAFFSHKAWWLGLMCSGKTPSLEFLDGILGREHFSDFASGFFIKTLYSFLQTHANPANCCRAVPGWPDPGDGVT